jgi:hypothetical protein
VALASFAHRPAGQGPCLAAKSVLVLFVVVATLPVADRSWSQTSRRQPTLGLQEQPAPPSPPPHVVEPQAPPAEQAPPAREENPGLLSEMGKLFDKIVPLKRDGAAGSSPGPADGAKEALKDTGETLSRFATPSTMVSGRIACPRSANGTPDCKLGADKLCQGKGYKDGKSLNTDSAETCSAKVLIPGRARKPDDCRTDTYVTSALCQ